jgi:hypothetical protein
MKKMLNEGNKIHNFISSSGSDFLTSSGSGSTTLPGAPPLGRLAELERVDALLHFLQPLTKAPHLTVNSNSEARPTHVKYSSTVLTNQS